MNEQTTVIRKGILKPSKNMNYFESNKSDVNNDDDDDDDNNDDEDLVVDWNKEVAAAAEKRKALEGSEKTQTVLENSEGRLVVDERSGSNTKNTKNTNLTSIKKKEENNRRSKKIEKVNIDEDEEDDEDDDEWEDVDEDAEFDEDEDLHNNSSESFEQFIKENTLKLDIECAQHVWTDRTGDSLTPGSQSDGSSFLKTPTGLIHIIDWGAEMDAQSDHNMSNSKCSCYYNQIIMHPTVSVHVITIRS